MPVYIKPSDGRLCWILPWQTILLFLRILFCVLLGWSAYQTTLTSSSLTAGALVAVWAPELALVIEDEWRLHRDVHASLTVSMLSVAQTGLILGVDGTMDYIGIWLAPIITFWGFITIQEISKSAEGAGSTLNQKYDVFFGRYLVFLILGLGAADIVFWYQSTSLVVLASIQAFVSIQLAMWVWIYKEPVQPGMWIGGSTIVLVYIWTIFPLIPMLDPLHAAIRLFVVFAAYLASVCGVRIEYELTAGNPSRLKPRRCARFWRFFVATFQPIGVALMSPLPWMIVGYIAAVGISAAIGSDWWTSTVIWPPFEQTFCQVGTTILNTVVKSIYVFTSNSDFQTVMAVALQEVAGLRSAIYRITSPIYTDLNSCSEGSRFTMTPIYDWLRVLSFFAGPCATMLVIPLRIMPKGKALAESWILWAILAASDIVFLALTQWTPDYGSLFVYTALKDTNYSRSYTAAGTHAFVATIILLVCAVAMFVRGMIEIMSIVSTSAADKAKWEGIKQVQDEKKRKKKKGTEAKGDTGHEGEETSKDEHQRQWIQQQMDDENLWEILSELFSIGALVLYTGLFILFVAGMSMGTPFKAVPVTKLPPDPDWLISTTIDKVSALTAPLASMLDPSTRMVLFIAAMVDIGIQKIGCWGCFCVPDIARGAEDAWDAVSGFFGGLRRRRLLDSYSIADTETFGPYPFSRHLLESACTPSSCGGGLTSICVTDYVSDLSGKIRDLVIDSLAEVDTIVINDFLAQIPLISGLETLLTELPSFDAYRDLDVMSEIDFGFRYQMFGINFAILPDVTVFRDLGGVSVWWGVIPVIVLIIFALVLCYMAGVFIPAMRITVATGMILFVSCLMTIVLAGTLLAYLFVSEARLYKYKVVFVLQDGAWLWLIGLALCAFSLLINWARMYQRSIEYMKHVTDEEDAVGVREYWAEREQSQSTKGRPRVRDTWQTTYY